MSSKGTALGEYSTSYPYLAGGYATCIDPAAFASASAAGVSSTSSASEAADCAKGIVDQGLTTKTGPVVVRTCRNFAQWGMDTMSGCDWGLGFGGVLAEAGVERIGLVVQTSAVGIESDSRSTVAVDPAFPSPKTTEFLLQKRVAWLKLSTAAAVESMDSTSGSVVGRG